MQRALLQQTWRLFINELRLEWRNRFALMSIVVLLMISIFIVYTIHKIADDKVWHSFFYLILIFGVVQNISRSFLSENKGIHLYYKFMVDSRALVLSKIFYQFILNSLFLLLLFVLMNFFLPQSIPHPEAYLFTAFLFSLCNSAIFTFNSAIATGANNSSLTASVLSFPLLIPSLIISLKAAEKSLTNIGNIQFYGEWGVLSLLLLMILILSTILFRFIWSE